MTFDETTFNPVGKHLLVLLDRESEMTPGGLYKAPGSVQTQAFGRVLKVGPDINEIAAGDFVLVDEDKGTTISKNKANQPYNVYLEDDIIAILESSDETRN